MSVIITLVPDLLFSTRIEDTAKRLGYSVAALGAREDFDAAIAREQPALVIVALDVDNWQDAVAAAKRAGARVLSFGSHNDVKTMQAARAAGCDEVAARSRMAAELPNLLRKYVDG